jgi:hypothetical protein
MDPLRRAVVERAGHRCEYCQLHRDHQPSVAFHLEHIIARQHGGDDSQANLALACHRCNLCKGPNLTGLDPETGKLTPLFHPRQERWTEHFALRGGQIVGLTVVGRTTAALLRMNTPERIELRLALIALEMWDNAKTKP